ncbi:hypothetical protein JGH11_02225 [Dysgonomonas sp. Marseille-P4677]|uniref:hypothetical protein n=1 Tax=Dysgonomonas sp. Marseille-P4677 TaxID=2364790 RepID=UPI001912EFE1|nr:hypothetical protein [Dysgonomonas sp. Marseille-P4677]MBK5719682.1 hypothetical protein [Dysgonomonas sp. Marseille-P4677]
MELFNLLDRIVANKKSHFWLFFVILVFLTLIMMYFYQPLCPGQDFFFHYRRLQALMDGLKASPWLIYIDYNAIDGYGYFSKAFYPDFALIPFALIGNITNIEFAYQFMVFTMTMLCGVFTYITVNYIYKNSFAASISALLYTFAVYRLLDLYHRAALGETLTFTFIPIVFLGLYYIIKGDYKKWYLLTIGFSLMIFTHLISSVLMLITSVIFLLIYYKSLLKEPKRFIYLIIAGIVTLVVTAYYLYPMLEQMVSNTFYYESHNLMAKTEDSALPFHWIIWGMFSGVIAPAQIFVPGVGLLLTCSIALRIFVYGKSAELRSIDLCVIIGLAYIVASSPIFPWTIFPFSMLNFIQMPWRLFEFSCFFFAIGGGYYLSQILKSNKRLLFGGCVIAFTIVLVMANDAKMYRMYRCGRPITQIASFNNDYHLGGLEYIPSKVPSIEYIHQRGDSIIVDNESTNISSFTKIASVTGFDISIDKPDTAELPLIYYKGYTAKLDNMDMPVSESENGLVQLQIVQSGHIEVSYEGTVIQKISYFVTIIGIVGLCIYIFMQRRKIKQTVNK